MIRSDYLPFGKPNFSEEEITAVTQVMRSGWVGMGPETQAFERELAAAIGVPHVVTVSSCTAAMFLSLLVKGIGPGDEVICPSLTWCSTANVALYLGATPVFCDVDPETLCVTPELVKQKLTKKTRAVMVVHLAGLAVDVETLRAAVPQTVSIIEDAAHALGAVYPQGRKVGSSGNLTSFSFYANKNLSTGEGGAVALSDSALAERLASLRQHGLPIDAWKRFMQPNMLLTAQLSELGYKMNYTDLQACIGRVQLRRQPEFHTRRLEIASYYHQRLKDTPGVRFQSGSLLPEHSRHLYVLRLPIDKMKISRDELVLAMRERKIGASIHYAPLHLMPLYKAKGCTTGKLPNTEQICQEIFTLPISASMTLDDAAYVSDNLLELLRRNLRSQKEQHA
jgi:perosamine synthetase